MLHLYNARFTRTLFLSYAYKPTLHWSLVRVELNSDPLSSVSGLSLGWKNVRKMHIFSKQNTRTNTSVYIYIDKQLYSVQNLYTKKTNINYLQKREKK